MGAEFKTTAIVKLEDGTTIVLGDKDKLEHEVLINLTCDNPKCGRANGGVPTTIVVDQERVQTDPLALPDSFSHSLKLFPDPFVDQALWFCCAQCTKEYLTYSYVPPKSACKRMEEAQQAQEALKAMREAEKKRDEPRIMVVG